MKKTLFLILVILLFGLFTKAPCQSSFSEEPKVAILTFDCGIGGERIDEYLSILKTDTVKAVFCLVGEELVRLPDMFFKIKKEGHQLANHTYSHPHLTQLSDTEIIREVERNDSIIGEKLILVRPPYSDIDNRVADVLEDAGYNAFMYTLEVADWEESCTAESVLIRVDRQLDNNPEIILLHLAGDNSEYPTLQALDGVINAVKKQGYVFGLPQ